MSIKIITEVVEVKKKKYFCDVCGGAINTLRICNICKKHLCSNCVVFDDRDTGDYPAKYCKECWDAGYSYREQLDDLDIEYYKRIEGIERGWKEAALKKCGEENENTY